MRPDQTGSRIILDTEEPSHQRASVPNHNSIRIDTLNSPLPNINKRANDLSLKAFKQTGSG
ncbi:MAG: hypothetical protein ACJAYS_000319 [Lentimonas sp.]|jgi:hypothetical protein